MDVLCALRDAKRLDYSLATHQSWQGDNKQCKTVHLHWRSHVKASMGSGPSLIYLFFDE
jgi:hypothetical protein